jgi:GNAT superfamily N-acetyltransferase
MRPLRRAPSIPDTPRRPTVTFRPEPEFRVALPVAVRPVTPADVAPALSLVAEVLAEFGLTFGDGSATDVQMRGLPASYADAGGAFWVAVAADGRLVGTCGVYPVAPATLELRKMYLHGDVRGLGIGKRLLTETLAFCRAARASAVVLDTTEQVQAAIAFYEAHGFRRDDCQIRGARCSRGDRLDLVGPPM